MLTIAMVCIRSLVAQHGRVAIKLAHLCEIFNLSQGNIRCIAAKFDEQHEFRATVEDEQFVMSWNGYAKTKPVFVGDLHQALIALSIETPNAPRKATKKTEEIALEQFETFWQDYPRKVAKVQARKAWLRLGDEQRTSAMRGVRDFANHWRALLAAGEVLKHCPHGATWLNNERWDDELEQVGTTSMGRGMYGRE